MEIISEILFTVVDALIYVAGLSVVIFMIGSYTQVNNHVSDNVNEKSNVWEVSGEYPDTQHAVSMSSIIYDVQDTDKDITIKIGYHTVTDEDKENLVHNDASNLLSLYQGNRTFEKSYEIQDGKIEAIIYTPQ